MKSKANITNNISANNNNKTYTLNIKSGKNLKEIIPPNFASNQRILNLILNDENFTIKKHRDYIPPYEPYDIFPEWPSEEEVEVN